MLGRISPTSTISSTSAMATRAAFAKLTLKFLEPPRNCRLPSRSARASAQEGEVDPDRLFEDVRPPAELPDLLAPRDVGADPGRRVEGGDPGAAGAHALDEGALGNELDLELAGRDLLLRLGLHAGPCRE